MSELMLQKLAEQFGLALDFSKENVIPYLQQLAERVVKYEVGQSIFWMIIGIICIIVGIGLFVFVYKKVTAEEYFDECILMLLGIIAVLFFCAGIGIACCQINDLILCEYLPEKILLRYANINN